MTGDKQFGLLKDILDSAKAIRAYLAGFTLESFMADFEKQDAVLRRFEIMGEAASRVSQETKDVFPQISFRGMRGMRNIIAHDYGDVDIEQVWQTAQADLVPLIETLDIHLQEFG